MQVSHSSGYYVRLGTILKKLEQVYVVTFLLYQSIGKTDGSCCV